MKIIPTGINIDKNAINNFYKTYQDRQCAKFCNETNFETGYISYEDGVFLPDGTHVLIKENGKQDVLGKILHFKKDKFNTTLSYGTVIVNIFYDTNTKDELYDIDKSSVICYVHKNHILNKHNKEKYLQVVTCETTEDDKWKFVKVEYGNPDTKMNYMYGWKYYDNTVYEKKDSTSNKLSCNNKVNKVSYVHEDIYKHNKTTNIEHKIKPSAFFVPDEIEYLVIYIFLSCVTFIFKGRLIFWTILTIWYINKRKKLRDKYNG